MKFSTERFAQIWNAQLERKGSMSSAEAMEVAIELFQKEVGDGSLEKFERWLATDPAPDVRTLSADDQLGYAAMKSGVFYDPKYVERAYFTERETWGPVRSQFNSIAKAVIDAYTTE